MYGERMLRQMAVLVIAVAGVVSCGDSEPDGGAELACSRFNELANDVRDGVLSEAELRPRVQDIEEAARASDEPGMANSARRILAAVTSADEADGLTDAMNDFQTACAEVAS